jgi:hypothetical protein
MKSWSQVKRLESLDIAKSSATRCALSIDALGPRFYQYVIPSIHPGNQFKIIDLLVEIMVALSEAIKTVEHRLVRLVNEAIKYTFSVDAGNRVIHPDHLIIDPSDGK